MGLLHLNSLTALAPTLCTKNKNKCTNDSTFECTVVLLVLHLTNQPLWLQHCSEKFCSWYIWWKSEILLCVPLMQQETRNSDWSASAEEGKTWMDRWREFLYKEKVTDHSFNMGKKIILNASPLKQPPFLFAVFRIKIHTLSTESIRAWQNQSLQPTNARNSGKRPSISPVNRLKSHSRFQTKPVWQHFNPGMSRIPRREVIVWP